MSLDGKPQVVNKTLANDRPNTKNKECPCGGILYAISRFGRCSNGEMRCTRCLRPARRFGKGWTCGSGCF